MTTEDLWDDEEPDDWYDDMPDQHVKEEPDCPSCNDRGCRSCAPTRLQHLWWRLTWRISDWRFRRRLSHRKAPLSDEPPF